ncbi:MAG: PHP domain-containing protein [Chromatiaceae bacterium]|jgi:predicted metal-dependent phosphoesterase TrpH|nr:PHP domain-containing protein [Chromatiaceae bacterium]
MPEIYDLHTHSTASDGTLTPPELIALAAQKGVGVLALTDHDTLDGLDVAQRTADAVGLILRTGVEISVSWGGRTIHIIALGIDSRCEELRGGLARLSTYRRWRAEEIGRRLAKAGIEDAFEGAKAFSNGRLIGRTHFARFLVRKGYARSEPDVFKHYLVKGKPGHLAGEWATLEEAVGWICAAGGQAVIAHPARYRFTRSKLLRLIAEFKESGGVGIEVVSGNHNRDECLYFARLARENGLLASVGSDFHGPENPWAGLGDLPALPAHCTPIWVDWEGRGSYPGIGNRSGKGFRDRP